jgi:hypothetical protein
MCGLEVGRVGVATTSSQRLDVVDGVGPSVSTDVTDVRDGEDATVARLPLAA